MGLRTGGAAGGIDPDYAANPGNHPQSPAQAAFVWEKYREQLRVARAQVAAGTLDAADLAAYEEAARDAVSWDRQLRAGLGQTRLKAAWMTLGQTLKALSITVVTPEAQSLRRTCSRRPSPETSSECSLEGTVEQADTTPTGTTKTRRVLAGETRQRDTHARWNV
jgi:hypothetical protein